MDRWGYAPHTTGCKPIVLLNKLAALENERGGLGFTPGRLHLLDKEQNTITLAPVRGINVATGFLGGRQHEFWDRAHPR